MTGRWDESFPGTPSYRELAPPQPVVINLDQALARDNPSLRTTNPLRVSAGGSAPQRLLPRPVARLGQAHDRHLNGGMHVHRAQRQPPGNTGAAALVARQRHHPATALIEVDDGAHAIRVSPEVIAVYGARVAPSRARRGSGTRRGRRALSLHTAARATPGPHTDRHVWHVWHVWHEGNIHDGTNRL